MFVCFILLYFFILHVLWKHYGFCIQNDMSAMFADRNQNQLCCCSLFGWMLGCCAVVVESGKRTGSCVLRAAAHLGSAELFIRGCHGNIRSQSDVCICGTAVCDSSESHVTPSSLFTPSTSSPHVHPPGFVSISWFCRQHFTATCIHSSILLILHHLLCCCCFFSLSFYVVPLFLTDFLSCTLLDFSIHCFWVLWGFTACRALAFMHFWGLDLIYTLCIRCTYIK